MGAQDTQDPRCLLGVPSLPVTRVVVLLSSPLRVSLSSPLLCTLPRPLPPLLGRAAAWFLNLRPGSSEHVGKREGQPRARLCGASVGQGCGPSGKPAGALTGPSPPDLENHQHAGALARGWARLLRLPGARLQDPRLPVVSVEGRAEGRAGGAAPCHPAWPSQGRPPPLVALCPLGVCACALENPLLSGRVALDVGSGPDPLPFALCPRSLLTGWASTA